MKQQAYKGKTIQKMGKKLVWCAYFKKYFPERVFHAGPREGYQTYCKVARKIARDNSSLAAAVLILPKKDRRLYS